MQQNSSIHAEKAEIISHAHRLTILVINGKSLRGREDSVGNHSIMLRIPVHSRDCQNSGTHGYELWQAYLTCKAKLTKLNKRFLT